MGTGASQRAPRRYEADLEHSPAVSRIDEDEAFEDGLCEQPQPRPRTPTPLSRKCVVCSSEMGDLVVCAVCSTRRPCLSDRAVQASGGGRIMCGREASIANGADGHVFVLPRRQQTPPDDDVADAIVATVMWRGPGISPIQHRRSASTGRERTNSGSDSPSRAFSHSRSLSCPTSSLQRIVATDDSPRRAGDADDTPRPPSQPGGLSPARTANLSRPPTGVSSPRPQPGYVSPSGLGGGGGSSPMSTLHAFPALGPGRPQPRLGAAFPDTSAAELEAASF